MNAIEFLESKRMLADGATIFVIVGTFGHIELTALLDEYASQLPAVKGPDIKGSTKKVLPNKSNLKNK